MVYIFEDNRDEAISQLFLQGYDADFAKEHIIYSDGSGNLNRIILRTIERMKSAEVSDYIAVFVDLIPDNPYTANRYMDTERLLAEKYDKYLIVPLVCAEYYFIKSVYGTDIVIDDKAVGRCISRKPHKDDELVVRMGSKSAKKSFERYCKFIRNNALQHCARSRNIQTDMKDVKLEYFSSDCVSGKMGVFCHDVELKEKARMLLRQYPLIPVNCSLDGSASINIDEARKIVHKLLLEYNGIVDMYKQRYPDNKAEYRKIPL